MSALLMLCTLGAACLFVLAISAVERLLHWVLGDA